MPAGMLRKPAPLFHIRRLKRKKRMEEQDIRAQRIAKLERLRALGQDPYAIERYDRTHTVAEILAAFPILEESGFHAKLITDHRFSVIQAAESGDNPSHSAP